MVMVCWLGREERKSREEHKTRNGDLFQDLSGLLPYEKALRDRRESADKSQLPFLVHENNPLQGNLYHLGIKPENRTSGLTIDEIEIKVK
jgi:hypothetical protein